MKKPMNVASHPADSDAGANYRLSPARPAAAGEAPRAARQAYVPPALERLGGWSALTLQQSVPIFP